MASDAELHELVDLGDIPPEPSESYLASLDLLDNVVRECIFVSRSYGGIKSPSGRHFYASVLFTVLLTRGLSLLNLAPHTPWADKRIEHWDYSSLAGIARTMVELRIAFHYLCVEQCSEDEWDFRWNLFNLHDCVTRMRVFEAQENAEEVAKFQLEAEMLRDRLTSNPFFETVDKKRHKKLLHGQTAYLFPLEEMAEKAGIATGHFRWLYVLFSSHVHGLPLSFYRIGADHPERGRGLPSPIEESYSGLCLSLAATLIVQSRDGLHEIFNGLKNAHEEPIAPAAQDDDQKNLFRLERAFLSKPRMQFE